MGGEQQTILGRKETVRRKPSHYASPYAGIRSRVSSDPSGPAWLRSALAGRRSAVHQMKTLTRSNRIYDTTRFGQPEIRVRHRPGAGKKCPHYVLRCGCCAETLRVYYADDGLEIGGINGAIEDWREILLPLLLIEKRGRRFVDVGRKEKRESANKTVQATAGVRRGSNRARRASRA